MRGWWVWCKGEVGAPKSGYDCCHHALLVHCEGCEQEAAL